MLKRDFEEEIKRITDQIVKKYRPQKIILYGSCARGDYDKFSDIDLLIIKNTKRRFVKRIGDVYRLFYDFDYEIPFEPLIYTPAELKSRLDIKDFFINEILKQGKVLYEAR
jgi:predicted nucleotidyltransferase